MNIGKAILVATDFSELGQAAVEQALNLAHSLNGRLDVVHVFASSTANTAKTREDLHHDERHARAALDVVAELLRMRGRLGQTLLLFGDPAPMILEAAAQLTADLIVVGTHGGKGLGRLVMGNTAANVLRHSFVPVLVVKRSQPRPDQHRVENLAPAAKQVAAR